MKVSNKRNRASKNQITKEKIISNKNLAIKIQEVCIKLIKLEHT